MILNPMRTGCVALSSLRCSSPIASLVFFGYSHKSPHLPHGSHLVGDPQRTTAMCRAERVTLSAKSVVGISLGRAGLHS